MSRVHIDLSRFQRGGQTGKFWISTTVGIAAYIKYRDVSSKAGQPVEEPIPEAADGVVHFEQQDQVPEPVGSIETMKQRLLSVYEPSLYHVAILGTAGWGYKSFKRFNYLMTVRYADITYQIRRPDVLANKLVALKYLALPAMLIPSVAVGAMWWAQKNRVGPVVPEYGTPLARFFREMGETAHETLAPWVPSKDNEMTQFAEFLRNTRSSSPFLPGIFEDVSRR
mmetsp:Transcript_97502/g.223521  ORF Transcript_97502/g.223521 Transcript_97502/m.223521 type:complete len:225 (+) Transcript_97502:50-724(+)